MSRPVSELMAWASSAGCCVGVVEIGDGGVDVAGSARAEVGGYGGELLRVAGDEEEACALAGPDAAGGFGDAGGSAEDEDLLGCCGLQYGLVIVAVVVRSLRVTRSQKLEVRSGSR